MFEKYKHYISTFFWWYYIVTCYCTLVQLVGKSRRLSELQDFGICTHLWFPKCCIKWADYFVDHPKKIYFIVKPINSLFHSESIKYVYISVLIKYVYIYAARYQTYVCF